MNAFDYALSVAHLWPMPAVVRLSLEAGVTTKEADDASHKASEEIYKLDPNDPARRAWYAADWCFVPVAMELRTKHAKHHAERANGK